jgi:AraC family transcriptional regulator, positive regulator of tynA and feaB
MQHWSTEVAAPGKEFDYWIDAMCAGFLDMTATSTHMSTFSASLTSAPLGILQVNHVKASAQEVYRDRQCLAKNDKACFYLLHKTDGHWFTEQSNRRAHMNSGDLVLIDARRCYHLGFPISANTLSLELPAAWLETWLPHAQQITSQPINGQSGWGQVLSSYVAQWSPQWADACALPSHLLTDHLGVLLNLSLESGTAASTEKQQHGAKLAERIQRYIEQHFADPDLCAQNVAEQLGLSTRSIHRAMASQGKTLAQYLRAIRLEHATRMLQDRHFKQLSIAEIGRRVGYLDASQFSRVAKHRLGETPLHLRKVKA